MDFYSVDFKASHYVANYNAQSGSFSLRLASFQSVLDYFLLTLLIARINDEKRAYPVLYKHTEATICINAHKLIKRIPAR
jgi:hypothetical protein